MLATRRVFFARAALRAISGARRAVHLEANKPSVQALIQEAPVLVFSEAFSSDCESVKVLFEDLEADAEVVELDERPDGGDIQEILSELTKQNTLPNVFIKGQHIGGAEDAIALYADKKLEPMLK